MKRGSRGLARRYARALLDVASDDRTRASPETVRRELVEAVQLLEAHPELARLLAHPAVSAEKKKRVVARVWGKASELVLRLLELLIVRDRAGLLPVIAEEFTGRWNAARGVVAAEAVSAVPLEGPQVAALEQALGRLAGLKVELRRQVDPSVLGGLLVRMGGRTYDGTVRTHLKVLRQRLVA